MTDNALQRAVTTFRLADFPLTDEQREQLTDEQIRRLDKLFCEGLGEWADAAQEAVLILGRELNDERKPMAGAAQTDVNLNMPVRASLAVLHRITDAQQERLAVLAASWKPARIELHTDSWMADAILFNLVDHNDRQLLNGLIEADGSSHT
jgi:hypothetical protein